MQKPFRIERAAMDGTSRVSLFPTGLGTPLALTVDEAYNGKIYWSDEQLQEIYSANMDGSNKRKLVILSNANPLGLAVLGIYLYWIDRDQSTVERVNVHTGDSRRRVINDRMPHLSALISVDIPRYLSVTHPCTLSPCSHLCTLSSDDSHSCLCPQDLVLSANKQDCAAPPTCAPNEFACHSGKIHCIPKVRVQNQIQVLGEGYNNNNIHHLYSAL